MENVTLTPSCDTARALPLRRKRMMRSARLQSAVSWLIKYEGKNVLRGYCKHFGVDWRCAAIELGRLGINIDKEYLKRRFESEQQLINDTQQRKKSKAAAEANKDWPPYDLVFEAYLTSDFAALHALEHAAQDG